MRRSTGFAVLLAGGVVAASGVVAPAHAATRSAPVVQKAAGDLKADLDKIISDSRLSNATVGLTVRNATTGAVLYDHNANTQVTPASNNKLETSTAAFGLLGTGYRFRTSVYTKGSNLYLKGTGDPTMRGADYDELAAAVAAKGIKKVKGSLVADDSWFDSQRVPSDWDPTDLPYYYAAENSALTVSPDVEFDEGTVQVSVKPGTAGGAVKVSLSPKTGVVKIDNKAKTGAPGSASTVSVDRTVGTNTIVVSGSIPSDASTFSDLATVHNPTLYAADVFRRALKAHGVSVAGASKRGTTPKGAKTAATRQSMPLSQLATQWLKLSNNPISETMVKAIGHKLKGKGTWPAGLSAISSYLKSIGVDTSQVKQADGSGLSHANHTTPRQITNVLKAAQSKPWFTTWYNALPIAGRPGEFVGGTLESRMKGTAAAGNVHAKTGSLTGVTALGGYVTDPSGQKLIFSSVFNGYTSSSPKDIEDSIAVRLASGKTTLTTTSFGRRMTRSGSGLECSWTHSC